MELTDDFSLKNLVHLFGIQETIPTRFPHDSQKSRFKKSRPVDRICAEAKSVREAESCSRQPNRVDKVKHDDSIGQKLVMRREDVAVVMEILGFQFKEEDEEEERDLSEGEIAGMFEEKEASLDEVREAFDMFDENRDGFIDAKELQRVLCALGFKEGLELWRCSWMIDAADQNGDGKIDSNEFLQFMENYI